MQYEIITPVWSRQHGRQLEPGEVIEFQDNPVVSEDQPADPGLVIVDFDGLVKAGVMVPVLPAPAPAKSKKEVTDGTDNP